MVKDIDIALQIAADAGLDMRLARVNQALWHEAQQNIPEGSSVSELVRAVEALSGIELRTGAETNDSEGTIDEA